MMYILARWLIFEHGSRGLLRYLISYEIAELTDSDCVYANFDSFIRVIKPSKERPRKSFKDTDVVFAYWTLVNVS